MTTHSDSRISPEIATSALSSIVDVIIPVYRGLEETRCCLESVLAFPQQTPCEIVVINDCSPESELTAFLRQRAEIGDFTLLENPLNTGFVNAVNRGMVLHQERDVVLLNSDTEVHGNWLDRLRRCAYSDSMVGTVTPFSNNATICSYPRFLQYNSMSLDWPLSTLDNKFSEVNHGLSVEIPTAVGFCMYITRHCLNQVGYFSALDFKEGYGEENDYSMRALDFGFKHLLCADVFVYHKGSVSFGEEAEQLCAIAQEKLKKIHPNYFALVNDFCHRDPARILRRRIDIARLIGSTRRRMLIITHDLGGGTEKHVQELAGVLEQEYEILILRPNGLRMVCLSWSRSGEEYTVYFFLPYDYQLLLKFLKNIGIIIIHIHHIIGLNQQILQLIHDLDVFHYFTLHDYYPICPQYTLTLKNGNYCGEPDVSGCTVCLAERPAPYGLDILSWRSFFNDLLVKAAKVIVPSEDMLRRMKQYIPDANYVYLAHHKSFSPLQNTDIHLGGTELKVLVLGKLSLPKGLKVLEACAMDAKLRKLPLCFRVIGTAEEHVMTEPDIPLSFYGSYSDKDLLSLIDRERGDLIFFPALWPESYSYTLSYAMYTGLPIVAPHLGAFSERLVQYPMAWLMDWNSSAKCWNDLFMSFHNSQQMVGDLGIQVPSVNENYFEAYNRLLAETKPDVLEDHGPKKLLIDIPKFNFYKKDDYYGKHYIDCLNRLELIDIIQNLGLNQESEKLTSEEFIKSISFMKEELVLRNKEIIDMKLDHQERLKYLVDEIEGMQIENKLLHEEINRLNEKNRQMNAEGKELKDEIISLHDTITEIYASTSWRVTVPLRSMKKMMTGVKQKKDNQSINEMSRILLAADKNKDFLLSSSTELDKSIFDRLAMMVLNLFLASGQRLKLPFSSTPKVSIILVLYNRAPLTFACLSSIKAFTDEQLIEIVIVDNASTDDTQNLLERLEAVKIIRNSDNLGFLHACNQAGKIAKGEMLLFLNNDAQLLPGTLANALATLENSSKIGAVGGKIVLLDGSLQEAGNIVWKDGSCSGYGRGDNPLESIYMFQRAVDYCSGAFLLTKRKYFDDLGGFDIDFAPAYYEETDYCFRLQERGLATVYDPNAVILHYEFGSAVSPQQGIKQQKANQNIFKEKHKNVLVNHYDNSLDPILFARQVGKPKLRVLFVDDRVPHKGLGQGFPRANLILSLMVEFGLFVTLYPLRFPSEEWERVYSDIPRTVEVMVNHGLDRFNKFLNERKDYYDLLFISRPHNMQLIQEIRKEQPDCFKGMKIIYDAEAVFATREILYKEVLGQSISDKDKRRLIYDELKLAKYTNAVITVSEIERNYFREFGFKETCVLGHAMMVTPTPNEYIQRHHILFVGAMPNDVSPNTDSIIWFVEKVFPYVREILGEEVVLQVVGLNSSMRVATLECGSVKILGYVDDLFSIYNESRLFIAPTRFAGGIPFKAHEAAAHGVPMVVSTLIASQLNWESDKDLLVASTDDPKAFAHQLVRLYSDAILWNTIRNNALRRIQSECAPQAFRQTLKTLIQNTTQVFDS